MPAIEETLQTLNEVLSRTSDANKHSEIEEQIGDIKATPGLQTGEEERARRRELELATELQKAHRQSDLNSQLDAIMRPLEAPEAADAGARITVAGKILMSDFHENLFKTPRIASV